MKVMVKRRNSEEMLYLKFKFTLGYKVEVYVD